MTSQVRGICRPKMIKTESIKFIPSEFLNVYIKKEKTNFTMKYEIAGMAGTTYTHT